MYAEIEDENGRLCWVILWSNGTILCWEDHDRSCRLASSPVHDLSFHHRCLLTWWRLGWVDLLLCTLCLSKNHRASAEASILSPAEAACSIFCISTSFRYWMLRIRPDICPILSFSVLFCQWIFLWNGHLLADIYILTCRHLFVVDHTTYKCICIPFRVSRIQMFHCLRVHRPRRVGS